MNRWLKLAKLSVLPYGVLFRERRHGIAILIYHRVGGDSDSEVDLPGDLFARQMRYLRDNYSVISLNRLLDDPSQLDGATDHVAVTFDDGSVDTYTEAFPILQQYKIPATVYVVTRHVDTATLLNFGEYRTAAAPPRPLSWPQLREMVDSGLITVGSHTHSHVDLSRAPVDVIREDVGQSRSIIEDRLGMTPLHFAYPWGLVTPPVKAIVAQFFRTAVSGGTGKNIPESMDLFALRRIPIQRTDGFGLFRLKLKSYLDGEEIFRTLRGRLLVDAH